MNERFRTILAMDFRFHVTRPLVWVLLILLGVTAFGLTSGNLAIQSGDTTVGGDQKAFVTSEFALAQMLPLVVFLTYVFFVSIAAGMIIPRDDELRTGPVLHATKLAPLEYVWGKFSAVILVFLGVLTIHLLLTMFFNHVMPNPRAEDIRGPFRLGNYLRPALVFALPTILFFAGIAFWVGEKTRKPILVFVTPLAIFAVSIFFLMGWSPSWLDPRINRLLMWIEPSGFRWLTETWIKVDLGVNHYNHQPIGYDLPFLLSRFAYAALGVVFAFLTGRRFERSLRGHRTPSRPGRLVSAAFGALFARLSRKRTASTEPAGSGLAALNAPTPAPLAALGMTSRAPGFWRTVLDVARFEGRNLRSQPGLYLFVPIILLQTIGTQFFQTGAFGTPILLTSGTAAVASMNTLTLLVCVLLMFYTVESVTREWNTRLAPVYYATPSRTAAMLLGKAVANGLVGVVILLAAAIGVFVVLLVQGKVAFDPGPLLLVWGGLLVPTFVVWASFMTALLAVTGSRYATYAIGLGTMAYTGWKQMNGEMNWVGNWNLWSVTTWTDFGALQPNDTALLLNRLFYLAVMAFLIALTVRVFPRREHDSANTMDRLRPRLLLRTVWRLLPAAAPAIVLGVGLNVQVGQGFQGPGAEQRDKEYWGRNLATWAEAEIPQIAGAEVDVTLDPPGRSFEVEGRWDLVNTTDEPMHRFPMSVGDHFSEVAWTLNGEEFEPESRARLFVFQLDEPMAPGDTVSVGYAHSGRFPDGITKNGGGIGNFILPAGAVLTSFSTGFLPVPMFEEGRGIDEENAMEPKDFDEDFWVGKTPPGLGSGVRFPVQTTIRGPAEYAYHGVGTKQSESVEEGVRTVVWESDFPVNFFNVVAGKWDTWEGDGVSIHHHPEHTYNIEEMGETLEAARKNYSEWFYPYPWQDLRINEFAGIANYAQGFPTNITFSEQIGFLTRNTKEVDATFFVTAHEVAHQWWGNLLMPGEGPGGNILSEGLANYSTILLFDEVRGERGRIEFCKRIEEKYGDERRVDEEKPLVRTLGDKGSDTTVMYDKGGWVFWMMHNLMGREAALAGNQAFIRHYGGHDDYPVLQDYVQLMRGHAPDPEGFDRFVEQWFFDVVVPEYRIFDAEKSGDGASWTVTARVENRGTGEMTVDVAATRGDRFEEEGAEWREARAALSLAAGESAEIELACDFEPEDLTIDPDARVLMLKREKATIGL